MHAYSLTSICFSWLWCIFYHVTGTKLFKHFDHFESQTSVLGEKYGKCNKLRSVAWEYKGEGFGSIAYGASKLLAHTLATQKTLIQVTSRRRKFLGTINPNICPEQSWSCYFEPISDCDLIEEDGKELRVNRASDVAIKRRDRKYLAQAARALFRPNAALRAYANSAVFKDLRETLEKNRFIAVQIRTGERFGHDYRNGYFPFWHDYADAAIIICEYFKIKYIYATSDSIPAMKLFSKQVTEKGLAVLTIPDAEFKNDHQGFENEDYLDFVANYYSDHPEDKSWDYLRVLAVNVMFMSRAHYILQGSSSYGSFAGLISSWPVATGACHNSHFMTSHINHERHHHHVHAVMQKRHSLSYFEGRDHKGQDPNLEINLDSLERCARAWEVAGELHNEDELFTIVDAGIPLTDDDPDVHYMHEQRSSFWLHVLLMVVLGGTAVLLAGIFVWVCLKKRAAHKLRMQKYS